MKKLPAIQNAYVVVRPYSSSAALGGTFEGARYHVWFDTETFKVDPTLYHNPPEGLKYGEEGYFRTRKHRIDSVFGKGMVEALFETMNREGLIGKARREQQEEDRKASEQNMAAGAAQRVKEAAPDLLAALRELRDAFTEWDESGHVIDVARLLEARNAAARAIAKAEGGAA